MTSSSSTAPLTTTTTTTSTSVWLACLPGFFDNGAGGCATCPWGFWCAGNVDTNRSQVAAAEACPVGTASSAIGAATQDTCVWCGAGTYADRAGMVACWDCPAGFYCDASTAAVAIKPKACPTHTTSSARARVLTDCTCLPGYSCTYTRGVTLRLALNTTYTIDQLRADPSVGHTLTQAVIIALGLYGSADATVSFAGFDLVNDDDR